MGYPFDKAAYNISFSFAYSYGLGVIVAGNMGNMILPGNETGEVQHRYVYGLELGSITNERSGKEQLC